MKSSALKLMHGHERFVSQHCFNGRALKALTNSQQRRLWMMNVTAFYPSPINPAL
jgi:hypothetical protein